METTIQKWGNSLGIRIPSALAKEMGLEKNIDVVIKIDSKKLVISPKKKDLTLRSLLNKVGRTNLHREISAGRPHGKEIW